MKVDLFLHKPHVPQVIKHDPAWTEPVFRVGVTPRKRFTAPRSGKLDSTLYLPLKFTAKAPGIVRARIVREPFGNQPLDPTAYDERALLPGSDGFARIRFDYSGEAEKGRKYLWQVQLLGPVTATTTGTHYSEWWVL